MKDMKFQAGTFLEVENLIDGRKVVQVCKDGITYWDSISEPLAPVIIHPVFKPVSLGSLTQFISEHRLNTAATTLITYFRLKSDSRLDNDSLFFMRTLWFLAQKVKGDDYRPVLEELEWAYEQAKQQEENVLKIHSYAKQYIENAFE